MLVTSDKDSSRGVASARFPSDAARWRFQKNHGRAEAVLIAAYGQRELQREVA